MSWCTAQDETEVPVHLKGPIMRKSRRKTTGRGISIGQEPANISRIAKRSAPHSDESAAAPQSKRQRGEPDAAAGPYYGRQQPTEDTAWLPNSQHHSMHSSSSLSGSQLNEQPSEHCGLQQPSEVSSELPRPRQPDEELYGQPGDQLPTEAVAEEPLCQQASEKAPSLDNSAVPATAAIDPPAATQHPFLNLTVCS